MEYRKNPGAKEEKEMNSVNQYSLDQQAQMQVQSQFNALYFKGQLEIEKTVAKEHYLNEKRIDLEQRKIQLREYQREARAARYEEVQIREDGSCEIIVRNRLLQIPNREIVNFQFRGIFELVSSNGKRGFFLLVLKIAGNEKQIFLNEEKVGKPSYLMQKLISVGAQIFMNKRKDKENFLNNFWSTVYLRCQKKIIIPENEGWIKEKENEYKFIEKGVTLWQDIIKLAK